jgi:hypothetical protein
MQQRFTTCIRVVDACVVRTVPVHLTQQTAQLLGCIYYNLVAVRHLADIRSLQTRQGHRARSAPSHLQQHHQQQELKPQRLTRSWSPTSAALRQRWSVCQ